MLDGGDRAALHVTDDGAQLGGGDAGVVGLDEPVVTGGHSGTEEADSVIGRSGMESDLHRLAGMDADATKRGRALESCLLVRPHSLALGRDQARSPWITGLRRLCDPSAA